eukprot:1146490-Pelagomonas_calceolata.AAC.12
MLISNSACKSCTRLPQPQWLYGSAEGRARFKLDAEAMLANPCLPASSFVSVIVQCASACDAEHTSPLRQHEVILDELCMVRR